MKFVFRPINDDDLSWLMMSHDGLFAHPTAVEKYGFIRADFIKKEDILVILEIQ